VFNASLESGTASSIEAMGRTVLIAILMLAASYSAAGQNAQPSSTAFHWLNSNKNATLFERIKTAFTDELKPDDPEKVKPVVAQEYQPSWRIRIICSCADRGTRDANLYV
jgi:hypothetical protein